MVKRGKRLTESAKYNFVSINDAISQISVAKSFLWKAMSNAQSSGFYEMSEEEISQYYDLFEDLEIFLRDYRSNINAIKSYLKNFE